MGGKKTVVDWSFIKPLFRAGQLSNSEIARQYCSAYSDPTEFKQTVTETAIRKQAKSSGWKRDLAERVRSEVREKLVRDEVRASNAREDALEPTDEETIDKAAEAGAAVVRTHRKHLLELGNAAQGLLEELKNYPTIETRYSINGEPYEVQTLTERAKILKALADVQARKQPLDRKAYHLDDGPSGTERVEVFINTE